MGWSGADAPRGVLHVRDGKWAVTQLLPCHHHHLLQRQSHYQVRRRRPKRRREREKEEKKPPSHLYTTTTLCGARLLTWRRPAAALKGREKTFFLPSLSLSLSKDAVTIGQQQLRTYYFPTLSLSLSSLEKIWNIGLQGKKRFKRRGRACLMEGGALFFSSRTYLRNKVKGSFLLKRERLDKAVTGWWIYL